MYKVTIYQYIGTKIVTIVVNENTAFNTEWVTEALNDVFLMQNVRIYIMNGEKYNHGSECNHVFSALNESVRINTKLSNKIMSVNTVIENKYIFKNFCSC